MSSICFSFGPGCYPSQRNCGVFAAIETDGHYRSSVTRINRLAHGVTHRATFDARRATLIETAHTGGDLSPEPALRVIWHGPVHHVLKVAPPQPLNRRRAVPASSWVGSALVRFSCFPGIIIDLLLPEPFALWP